jgi:hypothetical protein
MFSDPLIAPSLNREVYGFAESQAPGIEPNEIYAFRDVFGYYHKIFIIKNADRVYTFQTVSAIKDNSSVKRFFDSIKIKNVRLQPKENIALQDISAELIAGSTRCSPLPTPTLSSPAIIS